MDFQSSFTDSPAQRGAILVRDVVARFRGSVLSGYPVLLMFRHPLNPNRWEKGSHSLREATMPWREARLLSCPQLIHLAGSSVASLCFHLSPRNDNAFHFCFTDICYQEHWLHSLIHRDERCWINSELYLLFSLLLLVKLPSTLLTSCQKLCRMSSPWTSKYRLQRLDYYFFFFFLGSEKWLQITVFRMMIFLTYSLLFQALPLLAIPERKQKGRGETQRSALPWPPEPPGGPCEEAVLWLPMRSGGHTESETSGCSVSWCVLEGRYKGLV